MLEICLIATTATLAFVAVSLVVLIYKRLPLPDHDYIRIGIAQSQATFEEGCRWNRQLALDEQTHKQRLAVQMRVAKRGEPVIPPDKQEFPDEETIEIPQ